MSITFKTYVPCVVLVVAALLSGCTANRKTGERQMVPDTETGITEKYWKLVTLTGKPVPVTGNREAYIILKADGNRLKGHGGCNNLTGTYTIKSDNRIAFTQISSTEMACPATDTELGFIEALQHTDSYSRHGDTLILNKTGRPTLARLVVVYLR